MSLAAENIVDLVTSTLKELGRLKVTDLMSDLQEHVALNQIITKKKTQFRGGVGIQWNIATAHNNSARHVGLYGVDDVNVGDGLVQASVPWRHSTWDWAFDRREIAMNQSDPEQIVDLIEERRLQGMVSGAELMEQTFWSKPADSTDEETPYGLLYWVVKNASEGFYGGNPSGFSAGCGGQSSVTYPRWRNWTATYAAVTKEDLVRKWRKASVYTVFKAPSGVNRKDYNTGDEYGYYTNYDVIGTLEEALEAQNDNLGNEINPKDGRLMFRQRPVNWVPYLDNDSSDPVYGINWGVFRPVFLKGEFMREEKPEKSAKQHTVYVCHTDTSWNTICYDRRRLFVLSK